MASVQMTTSGSTSIIKITASVSEGSTSGYNRNVTVSIYAQRVDFTGGTDVRYSVSGDISDSGSVATYGSPVEIASESLNVDVDSSGFAEINVSVSANCSTSAGTKYASATITGLKLTAPSSSGGSGSGSGDSGTTSSYKIYFGVGPSGSSSEVKNVWDNFPTGTLTKYSDVALSLPQPSRNKTTESGDGFTITGNANGGDANTTCKATETITTTYSFTGWKDTQGMTWSSTFNGNYSTTLYAQQTSSTKTTYTKNTLASLSKPTRTNKTQTYTVTYNGNGGSVNKTSDTATRTIAYSFDHWNSNKNGTGTAYTDSSKFTGSATVYAIWTTTSDTTTSITLPTPTRTGYTFIGWAESPSSEYFITDKYEPVENVTLYALWGADSGINYTINHYIQELGSSAYTKSDIVDIRTGNTDETLIINNLQTVIEGFTFKEGKVNGSTVTSTKIVADGSLVIDLYYSRNTYTVTLNKTDYVSKFEGAGVYEYGASVSISVSQLNVDDRIYHVEEWTGSTLELLGNTVNFTMPASSLTLTPVVEYNRYDIIFDGNGDDGTGYTGKLMNVNYNEYVTLNANEFIKPGYIFDHWNRNADDSGASYADEERVRNLTTVHDADVTLYAIWKSNSYDIVYNVDSGVTNIPDNGTKNYNESYTISDIIPEKTGFEFLGWSTANDGTVEYMAGSSYSNNDDLSLYPVWKIKTYSITYNVDEGVTNVPPNGTKNYNESYTISNVIPVKDGYQFQGWSTIDGGEVEYTAGNSYTNNESLKLYAVWGSNTYDITYISDNNIVNKESKNYNESYTISSKVPEKGGYELLGWSTTDGGEVAYTAGDSYEGNAHLTLYAIWKITGFVNTINHILTGFTNNDGNYDNNQYFLVKSETFTQEYRSSFRLDSRVLENVPNGFKLNNEIHCIIENLKSTVSLNEQLTQLNTSMVFNFLYNPINYKINYTLNGGTKTESMPTEYNILYGVKLADAVRAGSKFNGWTNINNEKITGINEGKTASFDSVDTMYNELESRITGDITVKANWQTLGAVDIVGHDGNIDSYQCFIYHDGEWNLYAPYIITDGSWKLY